MRTITLTERELHSACEHESGIFLRLASGQEIGTASSSPYGKVGDHLLVQERLWVSTDGQYYAQDAPGKGVGTHYDVISQDGQQRWFSGRYTPTGFDDTDPRYTHPEFTHMVNSWSNRGRSLRSGRYIAAFGLGFGEYDTTQCVRPGTGNTQRTSRYAEFYQRLRGNQMPEWAERLHIELTGIAILPFQDVVQSLGSEWKTTFWAFQDHYGNACIDKNPLVWQLSYHQLSLKDFSVEEDHAKGNQ